VEDWGQADNLVREIGDLQLKIKQAEASAKDRIDEIKAELAECVKPFCENIDLNVRSLEAFSAGRKKDFGGKKSRKLNFGILGWRQSSSVKTKKNTLELIKEGFSKAKAAVFIRVKENVDKEALAKLTDEQLAGVGARRKVRDDFFVEPFKPEAVDLVQ